MFWDDHLFAVSWELNEKIDIGVVSELTAEMLEMMGATPTLAHIL